MYTVDLHNHTKFSYDGSNTPEEIIENAIRHGVDVIGITDHQFSIGENLPIYYEYIQHCKIKYADKIKVLCGLEIGTRPTPPESLPRATDIFKLGERYGLDIIKILCDNDIFWELNTSGNYIYYYDFLTNEKKQQIIKESGIPVSVGSDTHYIAEYRKKQIRRANELLQKLNIPLP